VIDVAYSLMGFSAFARDSALYSQGKTTENKKGVSAQKDAFSNSGSTTWGVSCIFIQNIINGRRTNT
jgi:hypothetical protein